VSRGIRLATSLLNVRQEMDIGIFRDPSWRAEAVVRKRAHHRAIQPPSAIPRPRGSPSQRRVATVIVALLVVSPSGFRSMLAEQRFDNKECDANAGSAVLADPLQTRTGICRVGLLLIFSEPGISVACASKSRWRSSPSVTRARTGNLSVPTSAVAFRVRDEIVVPGRIRRRAALRGNDDEVVTVLRIHEWRRALLATLRTLDGEQNHWRALEWAAYVAAIARNSSTTCVLSRWDWTLLLLRT